MPKFLLNITGSVLDGISTKVVFFIYILILSGISLFIRDIPYQPELNSSAIQMLNPTRYGLGDPISFVKAGLDIARTGWVSDLNNWIISLWPPGFIILQAAIIKVVGENGPFILAQLVLAVALFSLVSIRFYILLRKELTAAVAFILPLCLFLFPMPRVFLLQPIGVIMGESFAIGFFLLGVIETLFLVQIDKKSNLILAGIYFALAAYFRSQFEIFILAMTFWVVFWAIVRKAQGDSKNSSFKKILVILMITHMCMLPWRVYHRHFDGSAKWVQTENITFRNSVRTTEELHANGSGFVAAGGGNLVCQIDEQSCGRSERVKRLFILTFLKHPFKWYSIKAGIFPSYWFSPVDNWTNVIKSAGALDFAINAIFALALILSVALLFVRAFRRSLFFPIFLWLILSVHSAYLLIFTVQQFEVRYFYFYKIFGVVVLILETVLLLRSNSVLKGRK
jgi:hypothetical protein